jgi:hypothetical protein
MLETIANDSGVICYCGFADNLLDGPITAWITRASRSDSNPAIRSTSIALPHVVVSCHKKACPPKAKTLLPFGTTRNGYRRATGLFSRFSCSHRFVTPD